MPKVIQRIGQRVIHYSAGGPRMVAMQGSGPSTGTPVGGKTANVYAHLNSLHNHSNPSSAQNASTRVANWVKRMSLQAPGGGNTYTIGAQFGFFWQWTLPPSGGNMFEEVSTPFLDPFSAAWGTASNIGVVEMVPDNFDGQYFDTAAVTNMGYAYEPVLLARIDEWQANAPNPNRIYAVYAGWPALNRPEYGGVDDNPASINSGGYATWLAYGLGAYQTWMELLVSRLQAARPGLDIRLHNISKASLLAFQNTVVGTVDKNVLIEDLAPHGRSSFYFIAAVADYIELFNEKPPAGFTFNPDWGVSSLITSNYQAIVDYMWGVLRP